MAHHAVAAAGGNGVADLIASCSSRIMLRMARRHVHDLEGGHQLPVHAGQQLLGDHRLQHRAELDADLRLLRAAGKESTMRSMVFTAPLVCRRGDQQVAGLRRGHGGADGLVVPHLAQQDHVRRLAQAGAQGGEIVRRCRWRSPAG